MNKKIFILIAFIVFLSGCSSEVNISITDKFINEDVNIRFAENNSYTKDTFRKFIPLYYDEAIVDTMPDEKVKGVLYYEYGIRELSDEYIVNYKNSFSFSNYGKARTINSAFKSSFVSYDKKGNVLTISTDSEGIKLFNNYDDLKEVKVNITTNNEVLDNNADNINGNIYTWIFTKSKNDKSIYLKIDFNTEEKEEEEEEKETPVQEEKEEKKDKTSKSVVFIIIGSILAFLLFVIVANKINNRKYE